MVEVPDPRLQQLAAIVAPERVVPAIVEFVDIAGLVAGASQGEGLGNQFLSHIRETDAIVNVVRCFDDPNVIHVAGRVDPIADIEVIQTELCLADLATVEKGLARWQKVAKAGQDKDAQRLVDVLLKCQAVLDQGRPVRSLDFSKEELTVLKPLCLITAKPAMFVANIAEDGFEHNPLLERLRAHADAQRAPVVAICAKTEAELADMGDEDRLLFLHEMGQDEPGLNRLIRAAFRLLGLQTYFTAGVKEDRAAGGRRDPHRLRARLHPRADDRLRRLRRLRRRAGGEGGRQDARRRQGLCRQGRGCPELPVQRVVRCATLDGTHRAAPLPPVASLQILAIPLGIAAVRAWPRGQIRWPISTAWHRTRHPRAGFEPTAATGPQTPIDVAVHGLAPRHLRIVRGRGEPSRLWNEFSARHHDRGYTPMNR